MNFANTLTIFRIFLVPFFFTALLSYHHGAESYRWIALGIFSVASLTDALDGFWARATKTRTNLGKFLDPFADKLLLLSGYMGLLFVDALPYRPPLWITVTIIFRDLVIIVGMIIIFIFTGNLRVAPNILGKVTTAFQMITLISILLTFNFSFIFWYISAALTIFSCFFYVARDLKLLKSL